MSIKTKTWKQYEAGKEYKRRIGLYETVRTNERFYRGDQWYGVSAEDLPKPVFNLVRRISDYLICTVASADISIGYTSENLPFMERAEDAERLRSALDILTRHASYRWEKDRMGRKVFSLLTDAAISGDGVLFCYWDPTATGECEYCGDIATEVIDNVNLFVSDVNRADIQSQEYVILAGRASVASLREEAEHCGAGEEEISTIQPDDAQRSQSGDMSDFELADKDSAKATYLIKFWRENGFVCFEKSTESCVIKRARTACRLYPVAYFNWYPTKNSFHGTSPVTALIPNQKYLNRAYAMAMKHMTDTAFSKIIYDKSKIPEWSNEVGQAIAAVGGGNISDAVSVVGVGQMQDGYLELIENTINTTKELMGATESALGDAEANNTSAILALQESSRIPLEQIRASYYQCIEDLANIWADMMCAYYPSERALNVRGRAGTEAYRVDFGLLKAAVLRAKIDIAQISRYSAVSVQNMLDKLLDGGYISAAEYVKRLPTGLLIDREALLETLEKDNAKSQEEEKA